MYRARFQQGNYKEITELEKRVILTYNVTRKLNKMGMDQWA